MDSGHWVRPVLEGHNGIPDSATLFGQHRLAPLDVIEVDLAVPHLTTKYQRENSVITSKNWRVNGTVASSDVLEYCSKGLSILHGRSKVVEPALLDAKAPAEWASLELRRLSQVKFKPHEKKAGSWVAHFSTAGMLGASYSLSVTDPVFEERLKAGEKLDGEWLLTISLTEPIAYPQFNLPELCYKLVAAVIPI